MRLDEIDGAVDLVDAAFGEGDLRETAALFALEQTIEQFTLGERGEDGDVFGRIESMMPEVSRWVERSPTPASTVSAASMARSMSRRRQR